MKKDNNAEYSEVIFKILLVIFGLFLLAFYKMMINGGDNLEHLKLVEAILNKDANGGYLVHMVVYPLYHVTTRMVSFICLNDIHIAAMCVLTLANIVSVIVMRRILNAICIGVNTWKKYAIDILAFFYLIFETFAGPLTDWRIYARQCGPNPWHNPTITFVRPIGLLALLYFIKYMNGLDNNSEDRRNLVLFSLFSTLSVLAKPSFMMVFLPAMGIYVLFFYWMRDFYGKMTDAIRLLMAACPSLVIIIFQFLFCQFYNEGTVSPVKFQFGGFSDFSCIEIVKVCIATFPIPIMAFFLYGKRVFESIYSKIGYLALVFGIIEMFFLTNGGSGDFSWGYDLAVGVITMVTLAMSIDNDDGKWKRNMLIIVFICQVVIGFYYVIKMYYGGEYWF